MTNGKWKCFLTCLWECFCECLRECFEPVHENAIEKPSSAVEDRAHRSDKRQEMIVRDKALAERFVEAGHRLSDQDGTEPGRHIWNKKLKNGGFETWSPTACRTLFSWAPLLESQTLPRQPDCKKNISVLCATARICRLHFHLKLSLSLSQLSSPPHPFHPPPLFIKMEVRKKTLKAPGPWESLDFHSHLHSWEPILRR